MMQEVAATGFRAGCGEFLRSMSGLKPGERHFGWDESRAVCRSETAPG